jgi:hypothetical protein
VESKRRTARRGRHSCRTPRSVLVGEAPSLSPPPKIPCISAGARATAQAMDR